MRRREIFVLFAFLWAGFTGLAALPARVPFAVGFDAGSDLGLANSTTLTGSHTVSGSDTFLFVGLKLYGNDDVTSVTYNGDAMTVIASSVAVPTEASYAAAYGLINPDSGSHNVVVTRTSSNFIIGCATSYTGVSQAGQPEANGTDSDSGESFTEPAATVTTANGWLVGAMAAKYVGNSAIAGTGTTLRVDPISNAGYMGCFDSNGALAAGSHALEMGQFANNAGLLAGIVAVMAPASGGGGATVPGGIFNNPLPRGGGR